MYLAELSDSVRFDLCVLLVWAGIAAAFVWAISASVGRRIKRGR